MLSAAQLTKCSGWRFTCITEKRSHWPLQEIEYLREDEVDIDDGDDDDLEDFGADFSDDGDDGSGEGGTSGKPSSISAHALRLCVLHCAMTGHWVPDAVRFVVRTHGEVGCSHAARRNARFESIGGLARMLHCLTETVGSVQVITKICPLVQMRTTRIRVAVNARPASGNAQPQRLQHSAQTGSGRATGERLRSSMSKSRRCGRYSTNEYPCDGLSGQAHLCTCLYSMLQRCIVVLGVGSRHRQLVTGAMVLDASTTPPVKAPRQSVPLLLTAAKPA